MISHKFAEREKTARLMAYLDISVTEYIEGFSELMEERVAKELREGLDELKAAESCSEEFEAWLKSKCGPMPTDRFSSPLEIIFQAERRRGVSISPLAPTQTKSGQA
jgi:hypothetical protein